MKAKARKLTLEADLVAEDGLNQKGRSVEQSMVAKNPGMGMTPNPGSQPKRQTKYRDGKATQIRRIKKNSS